MDATIKARWLDALRSGEYDQATRALRVDNGDGGVRYCCLGVLCDIMGESWSEPDCDGLCSTRSGEVGFPPRRIAEATGASLSDWGKLASMNDDGKTFPVIADYIDMNL